MILFSLVFYSFGGIKYTVLLLLSALLNYLGALGISYFSIQYLRCTVMILTVTANLTLLGYYKYASFAVSIVNSLGGSFTVPEIVLPLGISFYTFQGMLPP